MNKALSKHSKIAIPVLAISLAAGLYTAHVLYPPTPGPLAATTALSADLSLVVVLGLAEALPVSLVGYFWARHLQKHYIYEAEKESEADASKSENSETKPLPKPAPAFLSIIIPIVLIVLKSIVYYPTHPFGQGHAAQ